MLAVTYRSGHPYPSRNAFGHVEMACNRAFSLSDAMKFQDRVGASESMSLSTYESEGGSAKKWSVGQAVVGWSVCSPTVFGYRKDCKMRRGPSVEMYIAEGTTQTCRLDFET